MWPAADKSRTSITDIAMGHYLHDLRALKSLQQVLQTVKGLSASVRGTQERQPQWQKPHVKTWQTFEKKF